MGCRCGDINRLKGYMQKASNVLTKNCIAYSYNSSCIAVLELVKSEAWNMAESEKLKTDTDILPTLTDELQTAQKNTENAIKAGVAKMNETLGRWRSEDSAHHRAEEEARKKAEEAAKAAKAAAQAAK